MLESLRTGVWLTSQRLRVYPVILLALFGLALVLLVATSTGNLDRFGRPLGTDFSEIWAAGIEANAGHPAQPYDNAAHYAEQQLLFGPATSFYVWPYPPYFLALAAVLALLPYLPALAIWQFATLPFYLAPIFVLLRADAVPARQVLIAALAFPAVFVNLVHGHNGFLTAGLLAGGVLCLNSRPLLAGVLFAALAYKPQFGLVVPVALIAGGHWRSLATATGALALMTGASISAFGMETWRAFLASTTFTREVVLEQGATGWEKIQSTFAAVRMFGGTTGAAYLAQGLATCAVLAALAWLWRCNADRRLQLASIMVASLLTTPYCLDYDMVLLGPALAAAIGYGLHKGFGPYEKTTLAFVWIVPLLARTVAGDFFIPAGVIVMGLFFVGLVRRANCERDRLWALASCTN